AQIDRELDTCFACGKDELARALVRRKLEARERGRIAAHRLQNIADSISALEARIAGERARLESMRQKAELLAAERSDAAGPCVADPAGGIRDEDVEVAFLVEQQKRRAS